MTRKIRPRTKTKFATAVCGGWRRVTREPLNNLPHHGAAGRRTVRRPGVGGRPHLADPLGRVHLHQKTYHQNPLHGADGAVPPPGCRPRGSAPTGMITAENRMRLRRWPGSCLLPTLVWGSRMDVCPILIPLEVFLAQGVFALSCWTHGGPKIL